MNSEVNPSPGLYDFLGWLEVNKTRLLTGFVVVTVLGFAFYAYSLNRRGTEQKASAALLELRAPLNPGEGAKETAASAYLKLLNDFPGTSAANQALLLAAGALFGEGNYAEAQSKFEAFLSQHPNHTLAGTAAFGSAAAVEAQGKLDEALAAYQSVLTRYPKSAVVDDVKFALARVYDLKNQPEQAFKLYEELSRPNAMSSARAVSLKEELTTRFPEAARKAASAAAATVLPASAAGTNAPAASTAGAP